MVLPTHPLRAAWFASYNQLLQVWEKQLLEITLPLRKRSIDLQALRLLVPTNVPPFAYHAASPTTLRFSRICVSFTAWHYLPGFLIPIVVMEILP